MTDDNIIDLKTGKTPRSEVAKMGGKASTRARGKPASGTPASGNPANGPGWGGPAKGEGAPPGSIGDHQIQKMDPDELMTRQAFKEAAAERMFDLQLTLAEDDATPAQTRLAASIAIQDRVQGKALSRSVTLGQNDLSSMTYEEKRAELDRLARKIAEAGG